MESKAVAASSAASDEADSCTICLSQWQDSDMVYTTDCKHSFCARCLTKVLKDAPAAGCPLCRQLVSRATLRFPPAHARSTTVVSVKYRRAAFEVPVSHSWTLDELRDFLAQLFYIDARHAKLIYKGKRLTDLQAAIRPATASSASFSAAPCAAASAASSSSSAAAAQPTDAAAAPAPVSLLLVCGVEGAQEWAGADADRESKSPAASSRCVVC